MDAGRVWEWGVLYPTDAHKDSMYPRDVVVSMNARLAVTILGDERSKWSARWR